MQDDNTTQEIEERLNERLLGSETEAYYPPAGGFRIDGSNIESNHADFSASTLMEENIIDATGQREGFSGPAQPEYRDAPFAIGFLIHLAAMFYFAMAWGFSAFGGTSEQNDDAPNYTDADENNDKEGPKLSVFLLLTLFTCGVSIGVSALSLKVMMNHTETLIQGSLIGSCGFMGVLSLLFLLDGAFVLALIWLVSLLLTGWYASRVWNRIPFASSNLRTALSAIQTNGGVCFVAYGISAVAVAWTIIWFLAFVGINNKQGSCAAGYCNPSHTILFFMILSYYWTIQILQNVLHVTVSGVVGTWWFAPHDALSVFSPAIVDSFRRATTYSFGSICMGSLLVSLIQTLQAFVRSARRINDDSFLKCIVECILNLLERVAQYFNRWAYCYVGLYGYDYVSAGKKAMELFRAKGWTTIITDNLVHRSLQLVAIVVGALAGFFGMLIGMATGGGIEVFIYCFFIGVSMAMILMNVVLSAVDTVIVAFAEAPAEFQTHHPALSNNMLLKWRQVFPDECGF